MYICLVNYHCLFTTTVTPDEGPSLESSIFPYIVSGIVENLYTFRVSYDKAKHA